MSSSPMLKTADRRCRIVATRKIQRLQYRHREGVRVCCWLHVHCSARTPVNRIGGFQPTPQHRGGTVEGPFVTQWGRFWATVRASIFRLRLAVTALIGTSTHPSRTIHRGVMWPFLIRFGFGSVTKPQSSSPPSAMGQRLGFVTKSVSSVPPASSSSIRVFRSAASLAATTQPDVLAPHTM
jgi:hypothetical protein